MLDKSVDTALYDDWSDGPVDLASDRFDRPLDENGERALEKAGAYAAMIGVRYFEVRRMKKDEKMSDSEINKWLNLRMDRE